jgi:hypothetical protein
VKEVSLWFKKDELVSWERVTDKWIFEWLSNFSV